MPRWRKRCWSPLFVAQMMLALSACVTWRASSTALTEPSPRRRPLQLWSVGRGSVVHGVVVQGDSVRAVPRWKPPECDSCAVYYSLHAIDSVRVHTPAPIRTTILVTLLVGSLYLALSMIGFGGPGS
jgi:hypothetical protein